ncbi:MAG: hypothetical protein KA384_06860 [Leptotrichiaceae bacterium]|nr:hypothetical protein [Leptotrichiaceae bacterium]
MQEKEIYEEALLKIGEKKISDAQHILENTNAFQNQELLGILYCLKGNFEEAYHIFLKLSKRKEDKNINKYLDYLEKTIKNEYIPVFNKLVSEINLGTGSEIENMVIKLENIAKNTELYSLAALFFFRKKDIKKAKIYYEKLKLLDESDMLLQKVNFYFNKNSFNKKIKFAYGIFFFLFITLVRMAYWNNSMEKTLDNENMENLRNEQSKNEEIAVLNMKLLESKALLEKYKSNSVVENIEEETQKENIQIPWTENELYNLAFKRWEEDKYEDVIKIFEMINKNQLPEYKKKEIIFHKAQAYNKLGDKKRALENYMEYLKNSKKKEYKMYLTTVQKNIKELGKGNE